MRERASLLGYEVDKFSFDEAVDFARQNSGQVVTVNPEMISNPELKDIINSSELVIPDGIGVEIGLRILGYDVKRIAGINFAKKILEICASEQKTVALVGAKPEVLEKTIENLKNEIPGLNIVYFHDGYYADEKEIKDELIKHQPRLILCALGSPKQEFFIYELKKLLPNSLLIGVGGSFDVWGGFVERAPKIWQDFGLEWLYRTIKEPKRLKRIFPTLPLFVLKVLIDKFVPKGV